MRLKGWWVLLACACGNSSSTSDGGLDASADGSDAGCTLTGNWACVGKESLPAVTSATIDQPLLLIDATGHAVQGAPVKACARDVVNLPCTEVAAAQTTNATGSVTFTGLPTGSSGFDGYFEVDYPNDMPNLSFVDPPIFATFSSYSRAFWSGSALAALAQVAGVTVDATHGMIGVEVHDCSEYPGNVHCVEDGGCPIGKPAGVSVSIDHTDSKTVEAYLVDNNGLVGLSTTRTCTSEGFGVAGKVGFFNVPEGPVTVTATLPGGVIAAKLEVIVRANAISLVELPPTM